MHIFVLCAHFVTHSVLRHDKKSPFTELQSEEAQDLSNMEPKTLFFCFVLWKGCALFVRVIPVLTNTKAEVGLLGIIFKQQLSISTHVRGRREC